MSPQNPDTTRITISIPTNAYHISGIRDFTMNLVKNMTGFSEKWAFRFQAIIDELCNNAVEHGSQAGDDIFITFINVKGETLTLVVEDLGRAPTAKSADDMRAMLKQKLDDQAKNVMGSFSIRGRGLSQIVYNWTDVLEFYDRPGGGLKVQVMKKLTTGEQ